MKQSVYPEIVRTLLEVEESIRIENGTENGSDIVKKKMTEDDNPEKILTKIQKIHQLMLKVKHKDTHRKLSVREIEIIHQICNGRTTTEIAKILNLSKHTIESHRTNIFSKVGCKKCG